MNDEWAKYGIDSLITAKCKDNQFFYDQNLRIETFVDWRLCNCKGSFYSWFEKILTGRLETNFNLKQIIC